MKTFYLINRLTYFKIYTIFVLFPYLKKICYRKITSILLFPYFKYPRKIGNPFRSGSSVVIDGKMKMAFLLLSVQQLGKLFKKMH